MQTSQTIELVAPTPAKPAKVPFLSMPGNPRIPVLVRGYGIFIRITNIMAIILCIVGFFAFASSAQTSGLAFGCFLQIAVSGLLIVVGNGLVAGRKSAVHGVAGLAALNLLSALLIASALREDGVIIGTALAVANLIVLGPPIYVSYKHWEKFE